MEVRAQQDPCAVQPAGNALNDLALAPIDLGDHFQGRRTALGFSQVLLDHALKRVGAGLLDSSLP